MAKAHSAVPNEDIARIAELVPFTEEDLQGQTLRRGSMLGGANPVIESESLTNESE